MTLINTNPQVWILTSYGLQRITEAMSAPTTERLYITKIKIGNADGTYYTPVVGTDNDLRDPIEGGVFPVTEKSLTDNTVTFKTIIGETSGGYNIREIGLYEEDANGDDHCFALGTCEPIVKPAYEVGEDYGYAMAIDYKLNIESVNLASVYDQIILDPENQYVKKEELEALSRTVLFVEGNLMDQISNNTHILGLNRAQQLADLIDETTLAFSNSALISLYTNLINSTLANNVRGVWGFNYTEIFDSVNAVKDFSVYGNNLSLNQPITKYESGVFGIAPYLNFKSTDYFYAPYVDSLKMSSAFTIAFAGQFNAMGTDKTILAQAEEATTSRHNWTLSVNTNNAFVFKVYTDESNYITYTSANNSVPANSFSLIATFNGTIGKLYLNGLELALTATNTGTFTTLASNNLNTTSYIDNTNSQRSKLINAKVSFLSLISTNLSEGAIRAMSLYLRAVLGQNIYRGI